MRHVSRWMAVMVVLVGCGGGGGGDPAPNPNPSPTPSLTGIAVTPDTLELVRGAASGLRAVATYSDATIKDVTAETAWAVSDASVATVAGGTVTARGEGSATITASLGDRSGAAQINVTDYHRVFLTAVTGTGDLSTWQDAGGKRGLEAADAICQTRAARAGLKGTFRAWLSDARDDAYCRVHGLAGKKDERCGQAQLPTTAGPWARMDGTPYAPRASELARGVVYAPADFSEDGTPSIASAYTATTRDGRLDGGAPCANWTEASADEVAGSSASAMGGVRLRCDGRDALGNRAPGALLCIETGPGIDLPARAPGRIVFVTSVTGSGALSTWPDAGGRQGLAAGDAICRARAAAAGLPNAARFKAWLSDDTTAARDRLRGDGPWVRVDGVEVAATRQDLVGGARLLAPIDVTETGVYLETTPVYTGTLATGASARGENCAGWSSAADDQSARMGIPTATASTWTSLSVRGYPDTFEPCGLADGAGGGRLYCFEDQAED